MSVVDTSVKMITCSGCQENSVYRGRNGVRLCGGCFELQATPGKQYRFRTVWTEQGHVHELTSAPVRWPEALAVVLSYRDTGIDSWIIGTASGSTGVCVVGL